MKIRRAMAEIEKRRNSRLLVFAASNLELELLPWLYDTLRGIGRTERLDVLFYCRGGVVTAARRIALMLNDSTDYLSFLVPDRCESSGTITALAAREIVAGPVAVFSPVDPLLQAPSEQSGDAPPAISAEDVRLFGKMARDWFGLGESEAGLKAAAALCESIFPTTLTSFYRSMLEARAICEELLSLHMAEEAAEARSRIVEQLLFGYHSHSFALSGGDLSRLGLPIRRDPEVEDLAWEMAAVVRGMTGSGNRKTRKEDWFDAILATRDQVRCRRRSPEGLAPAWEEGAVE